MNRTILAVSLMLAFGSHAYALPTGGAVSAGSATISGSAGKTTINQSSQNAAINWQSFSIGKTEAVQFVQPNSSAVALNRVLGPDPSSILGSLTANGKVFLVNPNGILFAQGAQVNVAGLVASTGNISDSNFMAGNYKFTGSGGGAVVNRGSINADGGYVALLGANVSNEGVISARMGTVALAAGNAFTLDVAGDGLLNVVVNQGAVNALAQNGGLIQANGGQVLLTAQSAGSLLQSAVNNTGVIQAQTVENHNGTIRLLGDMQSGTVSVGGTLDASGMGAGQTGGNVVVAGHHVGLFDGHINASGDAGGGTVFVGGGFQGNNPAVPNASATYMSAGSTISVDATTNGNGGTAVLWANDSTRAYGSITARGGAQGGNGGLIETSSHWLDVEGMSINASAPNGKRGLWLLDPADVTINNDPVNTGATNIANVFAPNDGLGTAVIAVSALIAALQAGTGTDVTVTTTNPTVPGSPPSGRGDITVALGTAITWGTPAQPATLTLSAAGDVNINGTITPGDGNLVVCCGRDINISGTITNAGGGGSVSLSAGRDISLLATGTITTTVGNVTMCAGHDINLIGQLTMTNAGTGALAGGLAPGLVLSAGNAATGPGVAGGTVNITTLPTLTRSSAEVFDVSITYNPTSYATTTDYSLLMTRNQTSGPINLTQFMQVYPGVADKVADGNTAATLSGLKTTLASGPLPINVTLNPGGTANFATALPGNDQIVTFSGASISQGPLQTGGTGINFALPVACCGRSPELRTTGNIIAGTTPPVTPVTPGGSDTPVQVWPVLPVFYPPIVAGLDLNVLGIRMPPIEVVEAPVEAAPPPVVVPPVAPIYVPPQLPRRPDRY